MKQLYRKIVDHQAFRYIFFGGCTTLVNLVSYWILRMYAGLNVATANLMAIILAILFAYVVNKKFVFASKTEGKADTLREFSQFIGMRLFTMFLETFGVVMLACVWGVWDMAGKLILQFVVLVLNFIFSKMYVFRQREEYNCPHEKENQDRKKLFIFCGFLIPAVTMLAAYVSNGVYPFGDRGVLIIDSLHQYLPFFTDFHEKLVNSQSLLYSFGGGLGYNMWAAVAYYLASPLNMLLSLVSMEHVMDFMAYLILLKIAISGGAFAWYLSRRKKEADCLIIPFACMYALSSFMIGYYFNIMWLDSIMVLPIVMYGIEQIVKGRNGRLYGIALFYGLFCNYYIGYMICLFSVLYFLMLWSCKKKFSFRMFFTSGLKFAWFSLLSGGMAAVVLLPAYFNLAITESADGSFPSKLKTYTSVLNQLTGHFALVEPINIYDDQSGVNIYCGVIVMILFLLYLLDKEIRVAERVSKTILILLLAASMNVNILNFIWHGFHVQNGLPNRFAFLYIAMLLSVGYDVTKHIKRFSVGRIAVAWIIPIALTAYCMLIEAGDREWYVYLTTLLLLVLYGINMFAMTNHGFFERLARKVILFVMTGEMIVYGVYGVAINGTVGRSTYVNEQTAYRKMIERAEDTDGFYRSEIDSQRMRNENMFMGANGVVLFSSTMPEATVNLSKAIGLEARTNKNGYTGMTKLFNDVFGIRYIVSKKDADTLYQFERTDSEDPLQMYQNEDALSIGFMVSSDIKKWDIELGEPMDVQSMFATLATQVPFKYTLRESYSLEEGPTYIVRLHPGEQTYLDFTENVKSVTITTPQGEKTYNNYTDNLFDLGTVTEEGEDSKANISLTYKDGHSSPVPVRIYTCSDEEYQQVYDRLAANQLEDVQVSNTTVSGRIHVDQAGTLLLTIPYDKGWTLKVDGEEREIYRVGEALSGADLETGDHEITMEYVPEGFTQGTLISVICVCLYMISALIEVQYQKRKKCKEMKEKD